MWLTRKKVKDLTPNSLTSTDSGSNQTNVFQEKKAEKFVNSKFIKGNGIRKRIMQLGAEVNNPKFFDSENVNSNSHNHSYDNNQLDETTFQLSLPNNQQFSSPTNIKCGTKINKSFFYSNLSPSISSESITGVTTADFSFDSPKEFNVTGLNLPVLADVQVDVRNLTLRRNAYNNFGFCVRRVQYPIDENSDKLHSVVFAEPNEINHGPPRPSDLTSGLLPGDQLIEINGRLVEELTFDEILREIELSDLQICLRVKAMPELAEFCRHNDKNQQINLNETSDSLHLGTVNNIDSNIFTSDISEEERYWLIHSRGFTICQLLERLFDGKVKILVGNNEMIVDSSDIDHANPTTMDRVSDVALLHYLNETSVIHLLRQRFGANLLYTIGGSQNLVYICPILNQDLFKERNLNLIKMFRNCRRNQMPAHIYSLVQQVYRNLQLSNQHQSVIFTGVRTSGKSFQFSNFIYYLFETIGRLKHVSFKNISAALYILETMGNCMTCLNSNASKFVKILSLGFDASACLCSANFQTFLLQTSLLIPNAKDNCTFNIFYYFWEGCETVTRKKLYLDKIDHPFIYKFLKQSNKNYETKWNNFLNCLSTLNFEQSQVIAFTEILAVIFHLSFAGATQGVATKSTFINSTHAEYAANILGITIDQLNKFIFFSKVDVAEDVVLTKKINTIRFSISNKGQTGQEALNSFIQILYNELFTAIVNLINNFFKQNEGAFIKQMNLLDFPGGHYSINNNLNMSNAEKYKFSDACTINDLVFNYVNERIFELIYKVNFCDSVELFAKEQVEVVVEKPFVNPIPLARLLDKKQKLMNCVDLDRRSSETRGLFYIFEEESTFPGATDDSFFRRLFVHFEQNRLIRRHPRNHLQFILSHCLNTFPTVYSVDGWLKQTQLTQQSFASLPQLLETSKKSSIVDLFTISLMTKSTSTSYKLRRSTQAVQISNSTCALNGFFSNVVLQVDFFINAISRQSRLHFVHCLKPKPDDMFTTSETKINGSGHFNNSYPNVLDISYIRQQIRPIFFVDSVRASSRGYPERMSFCDFRRRFQCFVEEGSWKNNNQSCNKILSIDEALDDRTFVKKLLQRMDIADHRYRIGLSQILLRNDVLIELEEKRDLSLSGLIIDLQRHCRKYLMQKWLAKRRVQEVAIKCIQRNAQLHLNLHKWPWWNLYMRIFPLLCVAKTTDEQRKWRDQIVELEATNAELKTSKLKLEGKLAEMEQHLNSECKTTQSLELSLEQESQLRIQLESRIRHLHQKLQEKQQLLNQENLLEKNLSQNVHESSNFDWETYEKTVQLKEELLKLKENELSLKLKNEKITKELLDFQSEMENLRSRNEYLEKRQKNFNNEIKTVTEEMNNIVAQKTQLEKQCFALNIAASKKTTEILNLKEENVDIKNNFVKVQKELNQISETTKNNVAEDEVIQLRKIKRELELKINEYENELEDVLQRNQILEQNVTRLEMSAERLRVDSQRENDAREDELSEVRAQFQRRLRAFEDQITELTDTNATLIKQNRMLESRARQLDCQSQASSVDLGGSSLHYKRELRKALTLLRDTQTILAQERENAPKHFLIRQLKEQLEDAETAKLSALKSRHSLENEISELRNQLDLANSAKCAAEEKVLVFMREKNAANTLAQEHGDQLQDLLKKYDLKIKQANIDAITLADQYEEISNLERTKQRLQEQLNEAASVIEYNKLNMVEKHKLQLLELKLRDVQAKLDLEMSQKLRFESIVAKLKDEIDSLQEQLVEVKTNKEKETENVRKLKKESQILEEQINQLKKRETELFHRYKVAKEENEKLMQENHKIVSDLNLAMKRIDKLQEALNVDFPAESDIEEEDENDFNNTNSNLTNNNNH